jgi:hypothetical protein
MLSGASEAIVSVLVFPRRPEEWESEGLSVESHDFGDHVGYWLRRVDEHNHALMIETIKWASVLEDMGLFHQYFVAASPTLQRTLVDAYSDFWHTYVIPEREPDITRYDDVRRAFPAPKGTIVVSEQEEAWITERRMITEEIGASGRLGKRKEELRVLTLKSICARLKQDSVIDNESTEKVIFRNAKGDKLGSFDGKTFR